MARFLVCNTSKGLHGVGGPNTVTGLPTCPEQVAPYQVHKIEGPSRTVETTLGELANLYELMFKMRRMEVASDMQYKAKLIRGFCHLCVRMGCSRWAGWRGGKAFTGGSVHGMGAWRWCALVLAWPLLRAQVCSTSGASSMNSRCSSVSSGGSMVGAAHGTGWVAMVSCRNPPFCHASCYEQHCLTFAEVSGGGLLMDGSLCYV